MTQYENYVCEIVPTYIKKKMRKTKAISGNDIVKFIRKILPKEIINHYECFGAVFLDNAYNIIGYNIISKGAINGVIVDVRLLFQNALICNASNIVIFHNHPSGNLNPSVADINLAEKIKKAGDILDIKLIECLIITDKKAASFTNE